MKNLDKFLFVSFLLGGILVFYMGLNVDLACLKATTRDNFLAGLPLTIFGLYCLVTSLFLWKKMKVGDCLAVFGFLIATALTLISIFDLPIAIIKTSCIEDNTKNNTTVAKITYLNASSDLIKVEVPHPGAVTGKEFSVIGKARGTWFFEASFPIELLDKDGKRLAIAIAQAQEEWMTENFVPFKADIKVIKNYIGSATLILHKDNPSGLPEHDASASFPIVVEY